VVTINREKALNALNAEVLNDLEQLSTAVEADHDVRAVIVTGAGGKAFVAGADITEMAGMGRDQARRFAQGGGRVAEAIAASRLPWIAAVNGFALGGGCELALACDFIYASKTARFGQPEVNLGVIPGFGGTQRLLRRVGVAKAKELVLTGDMIGAEEALRIGLVDAVFDADALLAGARATADKIAQKGPLAIAAAKRVIERGQSQGLEDACALEVEAFAQLFTTQDQKEGMSAFLGRRTAAFKGQ
jgi:enoyl-CoA hydratase